MPPPNIVLILADDLGFSDLGCYGGEIDTPNLDRLGRGGVRMSAFYNTARCSPSRASLLTGRHPHETGIGILTRDQRPRGYAGSLSTRFETVAEHLSRAGYATSLTGKWHLSSDTEEPNESWPTRRGFDDVFGILGGSEDYFAPRALMRGEKRLDPPATPFYLTDALGQHAAEFVTAQAASATPFFLYLAFTAPHWPLHAPAADVERYAGRFDAGWDALRVERYARLRAEGLVGDEAALSARDPDEPAWTDSPDRAWEAERMGVYAAQVDALDRAVGRVLDAIDVAGATEDTLIVFLSDNGACAEELPLPGRRFSALHPTETVEGAPLAIGNLPSVTPGGADTYASYGRAWANLSNTPFRLYKRWVHEGGIATPLLASWPGGGLVGGAIQRTPHQLTDVLPTLLEAAGLPLPADAPGRSMLAEWRGGPGEARDLFWEHIGNAAARRGDWKIVREEGGSWELYDLATDRSETHDRAAEHPLEVAELADAWQAWADAVGVIPRARLTARGHRGHGRARA